MLPHRKATLELSLLHLQALANHSETSMPSSPSPTPAASAYRRAKEKERTGTTRRIWSCLAGLGCTGFQYKLSKIHQGQRRFIEVPSKVGISTSQEHLPSPRPDEVYWCAIKRKDTVRARSVIADFHMPSHSPTPFSCTKSH